MDLKNALGMALLPALALTACSTAQPTRAATVGPDTRSASISSARPSGAASSEAGSKSPAPSSGSTPTRTLAVPSRCPSSVLRASQGRALGSAGHFHVALLFTNHGGAACRLDGYPGVSFTAGADAHQVGSPAQRDRRYPATPVTLGPGATVHATVTVANYGVYDPSQCRPVASSGYRVYPPGSTGPLLVSAPGTVCSRPGVQDFEVTVVRRGTTPD